MTNRTDLNIQTKERDNKHNRSKHTDKQKKAMISLQGMTEF